MFSVGDIYPRLKEFKVQLQQQGVLGQRLYFVKVDVQSCFDTINQSLLLDIIEKFLHSSRYEVSRYAAVSHLRQAGVARFHHIGYPAGQLMDFAKRVAVQISKGRPNNLFVDQVYQKQFSKVDLLNLIKEHVQYNVVKVGKRFYRQRTGIPQGSVLSTILCNVYYANLERDFLGFLDNQNTLLLRMTDDFLLVTSQEQVARQFLDVMLKGKPEYGLTVNLEKTLVNFDMQFKQKQLPAVKGTWFPYCGILLDTNRLEIAKSQESRPHSMPNASRINTYMGY